MKIAIVAERVNRRGGQEQVLAELITRLARRHRIDLFCFSAADIPAGRVKVRRLWCPLESRTFQALWLVVLSAFVVRPRRYDVILSQGGNSLVQNFVFVHTCHAERARALHEMRWPYERPSWWRRLLFTLRQAWATWMEGRAVRKCRGRVLAVSEMAVRYLMQEYGLDENEAYAVPNGVDHSVFNRESRRQFREATRRALGVAPDEFLVLFAGGLWFDKGLPLVIEALGRMATPAKLVIVGEGNQELFTRLAEENGVADRITFAGFTDEIVKYYAAADCLTLASRGDAFGLVAAEAAACGVALVTTNIGAADELVEDGVSGFLVTQNPEQIAERLDRLAADPALRERMGRVAHQKALALSWDRQATQIEQFLSGHLPQVESLPPLRPDAADPLRVAVISHSCVVDINQQPYVELLGHGDIELRLFTPQRWWASVSGRVEFAALPAMSDCVVPLPVWLPGQIHLHRYTNELGQQLDVFRPDILFVDEEPYSLPAAQGMRLAARCGYGLIIASKENIKRRLPLPFEWIYSAVLGQSNHVVVVSEQCREVLVERGYRGAISLIPHGVDPNIFAPQTSPGRPAGLPQSGRLVGYAGRLARQKGVLDVIAAAQLAASEGTEEFTLVIVGDGPLWGQVERMARSSGDAPPICVIGHIPHNQIPEYVAALDVMVVPSRTTPHWKEQFGRVIIEALACGVPVIGSDSGHIPHLIEDTSGGLIFPEGDVKRLAECIEQLLSDPGSARELGQSGREQVLEKYTWKRTARKLREVFMEVGGRS